MISNTRASIHKWLLAIPASVVGILFLGFSPESAVADSTLTNFSCTPTTVVVNHDTACTVTVTDDDLTSTPHGTVQFQTVLANGAYNMSTCTLGEDSLGVSSCQVSYRPNANGLGVHILIAYYDGSPTHTSSSDTEIVTGVESHPTKTVFSCTPDSVYIDIATPCQVVVQDTTTTETPITPTGSVHFETNKSGSFSTFSCNLTEDSLGRSRCQVSYTPSEWANHWLVATYDGDARHEVSSSEIEAVSASLRSTSIRLSCVPDAVFTGSNTSCRVFIEDTTPLPTTPTGNTRFASNKYGLFSTTSCSLSQVVVGVASCKVDYRPGLVGLHTLTATYDGDATHQARWETEIVLAEKKTHL